jgi:hypothetical protein
MIDLQPFCMLPVETTSLNAGWPRPHSLQPFCMLPVETTLRNGPMRNPWTKGGYRLATDGHIAIAIPTKKSDAEGGMSRPDVLAILRDDVAYGPMPPRITVPREEAYGRRAPCTMCAGKRHSCDFCGGGGRVDGGAGKIGGIYLGAYYFDLIAALPNVRLESDHRPEKSIQFAFDGGGRGAVMQIVLPHRR